jgi:hypothetical protein
LQTPHLGAKGRKRYGGLGVILLIVLLLIITVLSICYIQIPQNNSNTSGNPAGDAGDGGINVNTQDEISNFDDPSPVPEFGFGGGLAAILLCVGAFGLYIKYKK